MTEFLLFADIVSVYFLDLLFLNADEVFLIQTRYLSIKVHIISRKYILSIVYVNQAMNGIFLQEQFMEAFGNLPLIHRYGYKETDN